MGLTSPRRTRVVWALLVLVAAVAAVDGAHTWHQRNWNERIAADRVPADAGDAPLEARFAQAHALAASAAVDAALQRYRTLHGDSPLGQAARYNSANLLMRQAIEVRAGVEPGKAIALIELAKEMYRDVLRANPWHWEARYNLERAQRLLADPDETETTPPEPKRDAERAATTMRGFSPGLP